METYAFLNAMSKCMKSKPMKTKSLKSKPMNYYFKIRYTFLRSGGGTARDGTASVRAV